VGFKGGGLARTLALVRCLIGVFRAPLWPCSSDPLICVDHSSPLGVVGGFGIHNRNCPVPVDHILHYPSDLSPRYITPPQHTCRFLPPSGILPCARATPSSHTPQEDFEKHPQKRREWEQREVGSVFYAPETLTKDEAAAAAAAVGKTSRGPVGKARGVSTGQVGAVAAAAGKIAPQAASGNKHLSKLAKAVLAGLG
jgi:hypothetical protein